MEDKCDAGATWGENKERLLALEQLFHLFLEHSPVYLFFKDAELRSLLLSRNYEQMLGRPMDQILGKTMDELFPSELAACMIEDDRRVLLGDAPVEVEESLGGHHFATIKFPVKQGGKPAFLAGLTIDITEQKKAEEALRQSEALFRSLFETMIEGVAIHELVYGPEGQAIDYRILTVNSAFEVHTGLKAAQCKGRLASELYGGGEAPFLDVYSAVASGGPPTNHEVFFPPLDRHFRVGVFSPRIGSFVTVFEDITERKRNEEDRRRLEAECQHMMQLESLGSLAGGVAHDMNNVLQAIQGMATVLKSKGAGNSELLSGLDLILNASNRGADLVRNLTDFARKGVPEPNLLDLNELVRQEVGLLQRTTLQRITIQMELDAHLPGIQGDISAIGSALMNLCVNAIDAMGGQGTLCFRTRRMVNGWAELMVEDSGQGMSPEVLRRAAEPFFTTKSRGKGTGLGLSSVYGTMKAHGGALELQSESGSGTRAFLRFPPCTCILAEESPAPKTLSREPGAQFLRILLIDDDELIRETFPEFMELLGHRVVASASSGASGLRRLEEGLELDVVVLDQNMPGLSGLETLARLQSLRPGLPVVFCTGHLEDDARQHLAGMTNTRLLMKPYGIQDIRAALEGIVGQS